MGTNLVRAVSDNWGHLPAGPYKLLMRMAAYSLDTSSDPSKPPGQYWMGWAHLSQGLGRNPPDEHDYSPQAVADRKWMKDEVRRHTTALVKAGAVERAVDNPARRTRQVWKLLVKKAHDL